MPPVYLIGLMDIEIGHPDKDFWKDRYVSEYTFRENESDDLPAGTIVIIIREMAHFLRAHEKLKQLGISVENIAKATGLSLEEITVLGALQF